MEKEFYSKIVGTTFVEGSQEIIRSLKQGDELVLYRELDNKYDPNAVAVIYASKRIGYIPSQTASSLARVMDKDIKVSCVVSEVTGLDKSNVGCNIKISYNEED